MRQIQTVLQHDGPNQPALADRHQLNAEASQSMHQIQTVIQHDGPNHLGFFAPQVYIEQHDVLPVQLTPREHLTFYAALKT